MFEPPNASIRSWCFIVHFRDTHRTVLRSIRPHRPYQTRMSMLRSHRQGAPLTFASPRKQPSRWTTDITTLILTRTRCPAPLWTGTPSTRATCTRASCSLPRTVLLYPLSYSTPNSTSKSRWDGSIGRRAEDGNHGTVLGGEHQICRTRGPQCVAGCNRTCSSDERQRTSSDDESSSSITSLSAQGYERRCRCRSRLNVSTRLLGRGRIVAT